MATAADWIGRLRLERHPEGGWYRETYRAPGPRAFSTAIYYLLEGYDVSRLHRLASDECLHFYDGSPITVHLLHERDGVDTLRLGRDPAGDRLPQGIVPAGTWFGATVDDREGFALMGCTVAPGFDFDDFETARRDALLQRFPAHEALIVRLTPGDDD